jgi:ATP-dependent Lon protease
MPTPPGPGTGPGSSPSGPGPATIQPLHRPCRGGLVVSGEINPGGSIEPIHNVVTLAEMAVEKGAQAVRMPVASRRQLFDLSDDMATKVDTQCYRDVRDTLLQALME